VKNKVLYLQGWKIFPLKSRLLQHTCMCRLVSSGLWCYVVLWLVARLQGITSQETTIFYIREGLQEPYILQVYSSYHHLPSCTMFSFQVIRHFMCQAYLHI